MQKLEKLRLKGISEILSEKELKNVVGGGSSSTNYCQGKPYCDDNHRCSGNTVCCHYGGDSGSCCI